MGIASRLCATARLKVQNFANKGASIELPAAIINAESQRPSAPELRTVVANGQTEEEYIANFAKELQELLEQEWDIADGAYVNDTKILNDLGFSIGTEENKLQASRKNFSIPS